MEDYLESIIKGESVKATVQKLKKTKILPHSILYYCILFDRHEHLAIFWNYCFRWAKDYIFFVKIEGRDLFFCPIELSIRANARKCFRVLLSETKDFSKYKYTDADRLLGKIKYREMLVDMLKLKTTVFLSIPTLEQIAKEDNVVSLQKIIEYRGIEFFKSPGYKEFLKNAKRCEVLYTSYP